LKEWVHLSKGAALDAVLTALANEHRRDIIARLSHGTMTTPAIRRQYGFTKQALSRHVGLMESAGLISRARRGRVDYIKLVPNRLDPVSHWISELKAGWTASLNRLDEVLDDVDN
jgi:DNA-binding transcriptional ArsR family regulator